MLLYALLVAGALAVSPAPTVPTPYPTITPAPESQCNYDDTDQGPFALDCLQRLFLESGCSMRGESYPTDTFDDADDDTAEGGDANDYDKGFYNNNDHSWADVRDAMESLAAEANNQDCYGPPSPVPTPSPTPSPTSKSPTPSPSRAPTTLTPAPTYAEDAVWVTLAVNAADGGDGDALKEACEAAGYRRQYDATDYVVSVTVGDATDYYTVAAGQEICDLFNGDEDALVATRANGPFRAPADDETRRDGVAYLSLTAGVATIKISAKRTYSKCREIEVPYDEEVAQNDVDVSGGLCQDSGIFTETAACGDNTLEDRMAISLYIQNQLFESCDEAVNTCLYDFNGDAAFKYNDADSCWTNSDVSGCEASAYAVSMSNMLCTARCDYAAGEFYLAETGACFKSTDAAAGIAGDCDASINNAAENAKVQSLCAATGADSCYVGNVAADWHTKSAVWSDGNGVDYVNFVEPYEDAGWADGVQQLIIDATTGKWSYNDNAANLPSICRSDADIDADDRLITNALTCRDELNDADNGGNDDAEALDAADSYPILFAGRSGFTNGDTPGELHIVVQVPRTLFDVNMKFENSTNDAAEYNWDFSGNAWTANTYESGCRSDDDVAETCGGNEADGCDEGCSYYDADSCAADYEYELAVPWTMFNLGGAGGVQRLQSYMEEDGDEIDPTTDQQNDGQDHKYIFGATLRIEAKQPLSIDVDDPTESQDAQEQFRKVEWTRDMVVRIPMIVKFQKTVHVDTQLNVISTKFNYKTVAAIIQSIQYETQYFTPPYAKLKLQIRTKSQYPYRMNDDVSTATLHVAMSETGANTNAGLELEHIADDRNCTYTNADHMREGDICVQEWYLYITPQANVCYATGEYTITYEAACFHGKDVCYMPTNDDDEEITTVSFTFKIQTSRFCPTVVDSVDLAATLTVTGRNSFHPEIDGLEGARAGQLYLQGDTVYFHAETSSQRAVIVATEVFMVQVRQDLSGLIQTGYRAVHYDPTSEDMVVWTQPGAGRVADGKVTINTVDGNTEVNLMEDTDVFNSGTSFLDGEKTTDADAADYTFEANEAGFKMLLHAKAMPINIDSFGSKTVAATLAVEYEALGARRRRRRLLSTPVQDLRAEANVGVRAWKPEPLPLGLDSDHVSMSLTMSLYKSEVSRRNARKFASSIKTAMLNGLREDPEIRNRGKRIYDEQISIDAIYSENVAIWQRPAYQGVGGNMRRRLAGGNSQTLIVDFSFLQHEAPNAVDLSKMMTSFKTQIVMPASRLMTQEVFFGAVIHRLEEKENANIPERDVSASQPVRDARDAVFEEESGASLAVPCLALLAALMALFQ